MSSARHQIQVSLPWIILIIVTQLLLFGATVLSLLRVRNSIIVPIDSHMRDKHGNYYPAAEAIKYEIRTFQMNKTFITTTGHPTAETDRAWEELQAPTEGIIEARYETGFEIDSMVKSHAASYDPKKFMYGLDVYHQLHCLDYVRRAFWPDVYFPNKTEYEVNHHAAHCIEHLRNSIMCSGDISLDYWAFDEADKRLYLKTDVPHVCRDFGALNGWVTRYQWDGLWA